MSDYQVRLDVFEGPMDLLVYLIRKNEIDIYDIPIALITDQYLSYIDQIEVINLEKAGDFLLMAATLLQIKSRLLLPGEAAEDEEYEDPRTELVEMIIEYMQFKEIAEHMRALEKSSISRAERGFSELGSQSADQDADPEIEATVSELILAFGRLMLKGPPPEPVHRIEPERVSTAERTAEIRRMLRKKGRVLFSDLVVKGTSRMLLVVTLVALLEMARKNEIVVEQGELFSEIWIARRRGRKSAAAPSKAPDGKTPGSVAEKQTGQSGPD